MNIKYQSTKCHFQYTKCMFHVYIHSGHFWLPAKIMPGVQKYSVSSWIAGTTWIALNSEIITYTVCQRAIIRTVIVPVVKHIVKQLYADASAPLSAQSLYITQTCKP